MALSTRGTAGADLPLKLLPVKLEREPSRRAVVLLGAVMGFQLGFEFIGQMANKTTAAW